MGPAHYSNDWEEGIYSLEEASSCYGKPTFITTWSQNGLPWDTPVPEDTRMQLNVSAYTDTRCGQNKRGRKTIEGLVNVARTDC